MAKQDMAHIVTHPSCSEQNQGPTKYVQIYHRISFLCTLTQIIYLLVAIDSNSTSYNVFFCFYRFFSGRHACKIDFKILGENMAGSFLASHLELFTGTLFLALKAAENQVPGKSSFINTTATWRCPS